MFIYTMGNCSEWGFPLYTGNGEGGAGRIFKEYSSSPLLFPSLPRMEFPPYTGSWEGGAGGIFEEYSLSPLSFPSSPRMGFPLYTGSGEGGGSWFLVFGGVRHRGEHPSRGIHTKGNKE